MTICGCGNKNSCIWKPIAIVQFDRCALIVSIVCVSLILGGLLWISHGSSAVIKMSNPGAISLLVGVTIPFTIMIAGAYLNCRKKYDHEKHIRMDDGLSTDSKRNL